MYRRRKWGEENVPGIFSRFENLFPVESNVGEGGSVKLE